LRVELVTRRSEDPYIKEGVQAETQELNIRSVGKEKSTRCIGDRALGKVTRRIWRLRRKRKGEGPSNP